MVDLPAATGPVPALYAAPPGRPRGVLVMLTGGDGDIGIQADGSLRHPDNFLIRTRDLWLAHGYAVLIPDAPGGDNLRGARSTTAFATWVASLASFAHAQSSAPVFLVGTSQGSIAAMNGAAHVDGLAGVVLTESVSRLGGSHETVFDADPAAVRIPALVVANRDDRCRVAPPEDAPRIATALSNTPDVRVLTVNGGEQRSRDDCGSLTPHGYYGIEIKVIDGIVAWLDVHGERPIGP
ncbi:MAG: alpha/beta hydrolase [Azospirillaceae bacterium]|nr:alpha/beta hydrolase [Azospirillaceae bacterium]